mgnify:CR=1 FL=1
MSGITADNKSISERGEEVPTHMQLPTLQEILKLRQSPRNSNNKAFTFLIENLAGAVIGQRKWKTTRCYAPLTKHMSVSDEAFMLLVLENQYELWMNSETTKVGRGKYTENGPNKKFCGWTNEGMRRFNKLIEEVRTNQNKLYSKEVEETTFKTLAERYKAMLVGSRKNSRKRRRHGSELGHGGEDEDDDDNPIIPEDELILLASIIKGV